MVDSRWSIGFEEFERFEGFEEIKIGWFGANG